ncbi:O-linked N-acetylglucosamine transferase, SPINDLY family protein [Rubrivivax rivuli]|uniref:protein O-GlcNAc transferase n=1 Tax=Rubrivivax rivuli TaxID=1862385 RepID=A0A437REA5_9BURK|nr:tetratricopeptide repeat protein [Rubrivivax rivuli]RVU45096.1 tetratricopeptide repeat protein [Rubrivivax rivuli]
MDAVAAGQGPVHDAVHAQRHALAAARQRMELGDLIGGCELANALLQHGPEIFEAHLLLAMAHVQLGQAAPALAHAQRATRLRMGDAQAWWVLGRAHKLLHDLPEAVAAYRQALRLQPALAEAHVSLGVALRHGGDIEGAIACHEAALALKPGLAAARANLAYARAAQAEQALQRSGDAVARDEIGPDPAHIEEARAAAALAPGDAQLHFNLGLLLRRARRRDEAIEAFNRALGAAPARVDICLHLGHELAAAGFGVAAVQLYERWLAQGPRPSPPAVLRALAHQLTREGRAGEAVALAEQALAQEPEPSGWLQLCHSHQQGRRLEAALAAGRQAIALSGGRWAMHSVPLMVANYLLEDPHELAALHAAAGAALQAELASGPARAGARVARRPQAAAPGAAPRLRVGLVTADFFDHSVAFFMAPLLQHHDRSRFELVVYYNRGWGDDTTETLRGWAGRWVACEHLGDAALVQRIRDDGIDVLIDLSGHTLGGRLPVFAAGAAPLQMSYLGYPTVSGVRGMHRRVSDAVIDPGDQPDIGSDRPLVLPRSMFCYRPPASPPVLPDSGASGRGVRFGSFNNVAKLSDRSLALWAQVLQAVPASTLLLKGASAADAATRADIEAFFAARGIGAERLQMRPRTARRDEHLALYGEVDIALDSFPYNGATTTCEALWMGVPVISLCGRTHPSRMGASLLRAAGQGEWVCQTEAAFVSRAVALAADGAARAAWRAQARAQLQASELLDEAGFVAAFQLALEQAWAEQAQALPR